MENELKSVVAVIVGNRLATARAIAHQIRRVGQSQIDDSRGHATLDLNYRARRY